MKRPVGLIVGAAAAAMLIAAIGASAHQGFSLARLMGVQILNSSHDASGARTNAAESPEPSETPEPSESPEPSETAEPADSPEPTEAPEVPPTAEPTEKPEAPESDTEGGGDD